MRVVRSYRLPTDIELVVVDRTGRDIGIRLESFLLAHADPIARPALPDFLLTLVAAPPRAVLEAPRSARPLSHDTGDSGPTVLWATDDGVLTAIDERGFCSRWYEGAVEIVSSAPSSDRSFVEEAYAAIRWMICRSVFARGGGLLHAGGFARRGLGVLVVGKKGSGKTTLTTAALSVGAAFVASDRAFAWNDDGASRAAGWMCTYRVDPNSIRIAMAASAHQRFLGYCAARAQEPGFTHGGKVRIPPVDFASITGAKTVPEVRLRAIVELRRGGAAFLKELSAAEGRAVLKQHHVGYALPPGLSADPRTSVPLPELPDVRFLRASGDWTPRELAGKLLDTLT